MRDAITVETDLFEHHTVKPHFINPCCFGGDFAVWLRDGLSPLAANGFVFAESLQEDYGRGFEARHREGRFWIALSYAGEGPQEEPAQWVVSIDSRAGLKRLFGKSYRAAFAALRDRIWQILASTPEINRI